MATATYDEAMSEFATNTGHFPKNVERAWLLTDYDVWVRNPHYAGPEVPHPETIEEDWP